MSVLSKIKGFFVKKDSKEEALNYTKIGEFQFTNLLSGPVRFAMFDMRSENKRPELKRALAATEENILALVKENTESIEFPALIICETGAKSEAAAQKLTKMGYRNIVILDKGTNSLSDEFHKNSYMMLYR